MRKVVDSNYLQSPGLIAYLSGACSNEVVITDYLAIELYQTASEYAISEGLEALYKCSKQVLVSKNTIPLCGLNGRKRGLAKRVIDQRQTEDFRKASSLVALSREKHFKFIVREHSVAAKEQLARMLDDVPNFKKSAEMVLSGYTKQDLKIIREIAPYTQNLYEKQAELIFKLTNYLIQSHPRKPEYKSVYELTNTYLFRYAVSVVFLITWKISLGGISDVSERKLRNDMIDMHFVTLATYFDGLLSNDSTANQIHVEALQFIRHIQRQLSRA